MAHAGAQALSREEVLEILKRASNDIRELDVGHSVPRVPRLSAVEFLRDYVGPNKPVVLTDIIHHWPALRLWTDEYLLEAVGGEEVTVALTPNGRADAVTPLNAAASSHSTGSRGQQQQQEEEGRQECFTLPYQQRMPFRDFLRLFHASKEEGEGDEEPRVVPYLQFQNSSLTAELPRLLKDVDEHLPFATEALGALPEAINIWIGDERSVTSFHKDHYENLYAVLAGEKTFTLLPPSDAYRMRLRSYPLASFRPQEGVPIRAQQLAQAAAAGAAAVTAAAAAAVDGQPLAELGGQAASAVCTWPWLAPVLHDPPERVLWSSVQPEDSWGQDCGGGGAGRSESSSGKSPGWAGDLFGAADLPRPIRVTVRPGEVLYLPAVWWHQVEQKADASGKMIAVNYWYDMKFDAKYAWMNVVQSLAEAIGLNASLPAED